VIRNVNVEPAGSRIALAADDFSALEERIVRAVELVKHERGARAEAEKNAARLQSLMDAQAALLETGQRAAAHAGTGARAGAAAGGTAAEADRRDRVTMPENDNAITVEIYDQTYRLHGNDREYVERLAATVDSKMRAVAAQGGRSTRCG